jgi:hypothetical protein
VGGCQLEADIQSSRGVLERNPRDNRGITVREYVVFKSTLASTRASLRHRRGPKNTCIYIGSSFGFRGNASRLMDNVSATSLF